MSSTIRLPKTPDRHSQASTAKVGRGLDRWPAGSGRGIAARLFAAPLVAWIVARVVVAAALAFSVYLNERLGAVDAAGRPRSGLTGWDASWYVRIVVSGYGGLGDEASRFFPLLPLLGKALRPVLGARGAVLVIVNVAALASGFLLARLVRHERDDARLAARSAWLLALLPPAFVLVMGYAEALFLLSAIGAFLALRTERFGWAVIAGIACGLSRPLGLFLCVPAAVEALRGWRREPSGRARLARLGAAVAPAIGTGLYLAWAQVHYGDALQPFTLQQDQGRRGSFDNPISGLLEAGRQLVEGSDIGSGLHLPWALGFLVLLVVVFRRWPVSYGLFAAAILVTALSAENLDSLERYGLSAFPLVIALADLTRVPWVERSVLPVCGAGMVIYATLAFLGAYVP